MKRYLFAGLCILVLLTSMLQQSFAQQLVNPERIEIDPTQPVVLDFGHAGLRIHHWNEKYVQIKLDKSVFQDGKEYNINRNDFEFEIIKDGNTLRLNQFNARRFVFYKISTWIPLIQFKKYKKELGDISGVMGSMRVSSSDFSIYLPEGVKYHMKY